MSYFSEVFSNLTKDKETDVPQMSIYCNVDRSNMYKILRGTRNPPSMGVLNRIREYLRLTPSEWQRLNDAWHITVLGEKTYYRRKNVEHFLLSFPDDYSSTWRQSSIQHSVSNQDFLSTSPPSLALETQMDVNTILLQMLTKEAAKSHGNISILAQPDYSFLFQTLTGLLPADSLNVEHIFSLSNLEELSTDHQIRHIQYLETIFPLFVTSGLAYLPLYYYGDTPDLFNDYSLLSCIVMTSEHVLLCTPDFQQGIFFNDPEMWTATRNSVDNLKKNCKPLFKITNVDLAHFDQYLPIRKLMRPGHLTYIIQEEGCLLPLLTVNIMQEFLDFSLIDREMIINLYWAIGKDAQAEMADDGESWLHQFFTKNGLFYFVRTGQFRELPPQFCRPLSRESRIYLLKEFQKYCQSGLYRMLKAPLENLSGNLRLAVMDDIGYLVLCRKNQPITYLLFDEPYYLEIFYDYMQSLEDYCYSIEDTVECIQNIINTM